MITFNQKTLEFIHTGLFDCDEQWIHPTITVPTFELILVVNGEVFIREASQNYHLRKGDLLLLDKNVEHGGSKLSNGHTCFYWLHFDCDDIKSFFPQKVVKTDFPLAERFMKEIMHLSHVNKDLAEVELLKFLLELKFKRESKNSVAYEIAEYIRINRDKPLTVCALSSRFGYTPDHLSKLIKKEFNLDAKTLIVKRRLEYVESLLINTDYTAREIALSAGFENENAFLKFFKYHTKTTPSLFKKRCYYTHMNKE